MLQTSVKIQNIYYQDENDNLGIYPATDEKRITLEEAKQILNDLDIIYKVLLRVKTEDVKISIPVEEFRKYIIEQK